MTAIRNRTGPRILRALLLAVLFGAGEARAVNVIFLWIIDHLPSVADK